GKIALRNIRRDTLEDLREFEKEGLLSEDEFYRGKEKLQDLIDRYGEQMEEISARKQREIIES
ncbi:MAG: ribosome recycling factor, partial [Anaerolineae bacterium]